MKHSPSPDEDAEDTDRWLISYADFITLLFAFFVVMYALSQVNEAKYRILSDSLESAFGPKPSTAAAEPPAPAPRDVDAERDRMRRDQRRQMGEGIRQALQSLIETGNVRVTESDTGIAIDFAASSLFPTGVAELSASARESLGRVAALLAPSDYAIRIEGHADDTPIGNLSFASNWELSAARAASVARLFQTAGVSGARMVAMGFGEYRPIADNASAEGKARNRRVMVLVREPCEQGGDCD